MRGKGSAESSVARSSMSPVTGCSTGLLKRVYSPTDVAESAVTGIKATLRDPAPRSVLLLKAGVNGPENELADDAIVLVALNSRPRGGFPRASHHRRPHDSYGNSR